MLDFELNQWTFRVDDRRNGTGRKGLTNCGDSPSPCGSATECDTSL